MKNLSRALFLPLAAVSLFAAGCASSSPAQDSAPQAESPSPTTGKGKVAGANPCVLSVEEATKYLERQAKEPTRKDESGLQPSAFCFYGVEPQGNSLAGLSRNISITMYQSVTGFDAVDFYGKVKSGNPALPRTPVAGLGSDAFWDGKMVTFLKGQTMAIVSVGSLADAKQEKTVEVAKIVAERMP